MGGPEARRPLIHAAGGLGVLLVIQILGVYKPRGMTRRRWRQQREQSSKMRLSTSDSSRRRGTPRRSHSAGASQSRLPVGEF
jgi:hypothetical protein